MCGVAAWLWCLLQDVFGAGFEPAGELREPQYNEGKCQDLGSSGSARFLVRRWRARRPGTEMSGGTEGPRVWEGERKGDQGDGVTPREAHTRAPGTDWQESLDGGETNNYGKM